MLLVVSWFSLNLIFDKKNDLFENGRMTPDLLFSIFPPSQRYITFYIDKTGDFAPQRSGWIPCLFLFLGGIAGSPFSIVLDCDKMSIFFYTFT
jgi:hypothetical protein